MKIKRCERLKLIKLIKSCEGYSNRDIRDKINEVFNVKYNVSNIRYLKQEAYKDEWLIKLKKDNDLIKAWHNYEEIKTDDKDKNYAENLFNLFMGKIDNEEFIKKVY